MPVNTVALSGNLTRDAELRPTNSGSWVCNLTVAVNNRKKNPSTGEWDDDPAFVPCVLFGKRAQSIAGYLTKGTKVSVMGRITESRWEQDGQRRSRLQVVVNDIDFLGQRGAARNSYQEKNQAAPSPSQGYQQKPYQQQPQAPQYDQGSAQGYGQQGRLNNSGYVDDIPF